MTVTYQVTIEGLPPELGGSPHIVNWTGDDDATEQDATDSCQALVDSTADLKGVDRPDVTITARRQGAAVI